jgi:hypothetical protein
VGKISIAWINDFDCAGMCTKVIQELKLCAGSAKKGCLVAAN